MRAANQTPPRDGEYHRARSAAAGTAAVGIAVRATLAVVDIAWVVERLRLRPGRCRELCRGDMTVTRPPGNHPTVLNGCRHHCPVGECQVRAGDAGAGP